MPERDAEKWLFSDEELTPDQANHLEDAMKRSEELRNLALSWTQVERLFQSAEMVEAPAGFANRWREQLELRDEHARIRQLQWFLAIALGLVSFTLFLFGLLLFNLVASPAEIIVTVLQNVLTWQHALEVGFGFLSATLELIPPLLWIPVLMLTGTSVVGLVFTWILSLYRFAYIGVRNGV